MKIEKTDISGVYLITPDIFQDDRGYFFRSFCKDELDKAGLPDIEFVQMNESFNELAGTFRGFHFQHLPFQEDKLIRVVSGKVVDFAIDLRKGSSTFLHHYSVELSSKNHKMIFIPKGFAHGFITLEPDTILLYHHTANYQPGFEGGINYKDPRLNISLPHAIMKMSEKDKNYAYLSPDFKGIEI